MKKQAYFVYDRAVEDFARKLSEDWQKDYETKGMMALDATEDNKTIRTVEEICRWLLGLGADRGATLVAVGGGVTTDVVGLAAALYKRGIDVENVPTTLLGQVDAAIGGKTGVNLDGVKNVIGTVRLPSKVHLLAEPLKTLSPEEFRSGAAELLKTFLLFDAELYDRAVRIFSLVHGAGYTTDAVDAALPQIIELSREASKYKEKAVRKDLFDRDRRHLLNLGHTFGHAVEWWQNVKDGLVAIRQDASLKLANFTHGEAVSIGIITAAKLSEQEGIAEPGLADKLSKDLSSCGLPTDLPAAQEELLPAIENDKKAEGGKIDFVFLKAIGKPVLKKRKPGQLILK